MIDFTEPGGLLAIFGQGKDAALGDQRHDTTDRQIWPK
jgi:hypothetical protein